REEKVGAAIPFSHENLAPILAFYVEENEEKVLEKCIKILHFEGAGHSFIMHTASNAQAESFSKVIPASRILVNTPGALGGIGASTGLFPSLTLGCGAIGGSSSSNNIGPLDIINIRRLAYGTKELSDLKPNNCSHIGQNDDVIKSVVEAVLKELSK
ncbi:MAG: acetaldehyde dehydrogenase, partial [Clostridia bacterium]|nr:acetaldehyde dehydrogenase [Clostridia bacterium]